MVNHKSSYSVLIALFFSVCSYGMTLDIIPLDKIEMSPSEKFESKLFKGLTVDKLNKLRYEFRDSGEQKPTFLEYSDQSKVLAQKMSVNPDTAREILIGGLINAIFAPQGNDAYVALYTKIQELLDSEKNNQQSAFRQASVEKIPYFLVSSRDPMEIKISLTKEELQEKKELQKKGPSIEQKSSWYKKYLPTFKAAAGIGLGVIIVVAFFDYLNHLSDKLTQWFAR